MKRFSEDHVWVEMADGKATIGITAFAAEELGEITFVELPDMDVVFAQGDALCVIESVKAAADISAPIGGTVTAVNGRLVQEPAVINDSPEKDGWICTLDEVEEAELESLMVEDEYDAFAVGDEDV